LFSVFALRQLIDTLVAVMIAYHFTCFVNLRLDRNLRLGKNIKLKFKLTVIWVYLLISF